MVAYLPKSRIIPLRVEEYWYVERFTSEDDAVAKDAFQHLMPRIERVVKGVVKSMLRDEADREDIVVTVFEKLWARRRLIELRGEASWWCFVRLAAKRSALDMLRTRDPAISLEDSFKDVPADEQIYVEILANLSYYKEKMYEAADIVWLLGGVRPSAELKRQLLAAQYFYLDKLPWEEVCQMMRLTGSASRRQLDEWLTDPSVVQQLCYTALYWDNDSLAGHLMDPESPLDTDCLNRLTAALAARAEAETGAWSPEEAQVILLRFRNGAKQDKLAQEMPSLSPSQFDEIIARGIALFPFVAIAEGLKSGLSRMTPPPLAQIGLWKRIVFQYHASDSLPHKQIMERAEPPAAVGDYRLTEGILNAWLSNGRVFAQLAAYVAGETHEA